MMPIIPTQTIEMQFGLPIEDMTGDPILDEASNDINDEAWIDITQDVRAIDPIIIQRGNTGNTPQDRVSDVGSLQLSLDNSAHNSAGIQGYYSPDNVNRRAGLGDGIGIRIAFEWNGVKMYKFQGRVRYTQPDSGKWSAQRVPITAEDWLSEVYNTPMRGLGVQVEQRDDQLLNTLIGIMDHPPEQKDFSIGLDQYALAFHDELGESTMILSVLQKIALSGYSRILQTGNSVSGEVLQYRTRDDLAVIRAPDAIFNNSMINLQVQRDWRKLIEKVQVTTYPCQIDATNNTVLFTLQQQMTIAPGAQVSFTANYKDPNGNRRTSAQNLNTPVAETDYQFSSSAGGSGSDLNSSLKIVSFSPAADQADIVLQNNALVTGYLWFFQLRGQGIYRYDPVIIILQNPYVANGVTLAYDMPYQNNYDEGLALATVLLQNWQNLWTDVLQLEFIANRNSTLMNSFLNSEPGSLVNVQEDVTGISNYYWVNGLEITSYRQATKVDVVLYLVPAKLVTFFQLDVDGLDTNSNGHVLGY